MLSGRQASAGLGQAVWAESDGAEGDLAGRHGDAKRRFSLDKHRSKSELSAQSRLQDRPFPSQWV